MSRGIVKFFDVKKGWGFITNNENLQELFVHFSNINMDGFKTINKDDEVEYEIQNSDKGQQAVNVRKP